MFAKYPFVKGIKCSGTNGGEMTEGQEHMACEYVEFVVYSLKNIFKLLWKQ